MHVSKDVMAPEQEHQGEGESGQEAGEGSARIGPLDEDAHQEGGYDGRGDVGQHFLVVLEQGTESLDIGGPERGDDDDDQRRDLPDPDQFFLVGLLVDLGIEVHGEQGGGRIEDGAQGGGKGGEHGRQH